MVCASNHIYLPTPPTASSFNPPPHPLSSPPSSPSFSPPFSPSLLPLPPPPCPTWCSLMMIDSLYSWLPSTIPVRGLENHSLKSACEENTAGMRKCMRDHSSMRLFWRGVPVSSRRRWLLNPNNVCHRWLLKFLMFWAWKRYRFVYVNGCRDRYMAHATHQDMVVWGCIYMYVCMHVCVDIWAINKLHLP